MESIQVEIFGQTYNLKVAESREYIRELAAFVDNRMKDVQKTTGTSDAYRIAILAILNIADELHKLRQQDHALQRTAADSLDRLMDIIGAESKK